MTSPATRDWRLILDRESCVRRNAPPPESA